MPLTEQSGAAPEKPPGLSLNITLFEPPITAEDRMFFTEQLALLLDTGTSLHKSLNALQAQMANRKVRAILADLAAQVEKGSAFSQALEQHPEMFPVSYIKLVKASEAGGFMVKVLEELLAMDEKQQQLKGTITSAMTYPAFLLVFSLAVVVFVMVFVFPKFADIFASIQDQLPSTTIVLMATSDLLRQHWLLVCIGLVLVGGGLIGWARSAAGAAMLDLWKLKIPGVRRIYRQIYLVQLMRVLGLSLANGVSVKDALQASSEVVANLAYRDLIRRAEIGVREGGRLSDVFCQSEHIPDLARQMLATGEEAGSLARVMNRIADYYAKELTKLLNSVSKLAEPIMLVVMGLVVGIIVSSLILPIFKLSSVAM
ncbi:type II secretion system F family protein [Litorivivens sp.]|uniref:type II secretion system F family protein n=1 Tax=Litorivivens sp. TaxID=2020868 RepID=UPI003561B193